MNQKLLALYGLKWNPFTPEVPVEALHVSARLESFCWRIVHAQAREGGFALIHGEPGSGKSVALRVLAQRLARLPDVQLATLSHPQCNLADFYRELGDVFAVPRATKGPLRGPGPHNRWGGFKALRERWLAHLESSRRRAVLLIDEAQEMSVAVLSELRLMASAQFDSQPLLCVVLAGDARLLDKLKREELIPLGSRIRTRLATEPATPEELRVCLEFVLGACGNANLMSAPLKHTLCEHAAGNYRVLTTLASELLSAAARSANCPNSMSNSTSRCLHRPRRRANAWPPLVDCAAIAMPNSPAPFALMPTDLPPLSDSSAVEILDFLHELVFRFEAHYGAQIHRFYDQRRDVRANPPVAPRPDEDEPF